MSSMILDNPERIGQIDPTGMLKWAAEFADHWRVTYRRAKSVPLATLREVDNIVLCGMGGSAIAGDLLCNYLSNNLRVPFEVSRSYRLPAYASPRTLVIISSYSGTTEETIHAYREALARNCRIFTLSNGRPSDTIRKMALESRHEHFDLPEGYSPRAALGFSLAPLIVFFDRWGFAPPQDVAIAQTIEILDRCIAEYGPQCPASGNLAKQIAMDLAGKFPIIYAAVDHLGPVALRWQNQINENAKMLAHINILPEMNHNEILGWPVTRESVGEKIFSRAPLYPDGKPVKPQEALLPLLYVLYLRDKDDHPRTAHRFDVMKKVIGTYGVPIREVHSRGEGLLARMMSLISLGDFVSVYLAVLMGINPTPIPGIDYLKENLAAI